MNTPPCSECQHPSRFLTASSAGAFVDYYRCDDCGHVFHVPKDHPEAVPVAVTSSAVMTAAGANQSERPALR